MQHLELLRLELKKAREQVEAIEKVCQNPYAKAEHFAQRDEARGYWRGLAKAVETVLENKQQKESIH